MTSNLVSIIIPAYNEAATIHLVLNKVKDVKEINGLSKEAIIVNDCSTDSTVDAVKTYQEQTPDLSITLLKHNINTGKGGALHTGIAAASGKDVLIQDADLEYDPLEYNDLLRP